MFSMARRFSVPLTIPRVITSYNSAQNVAILLRSRLISDYNDTSASCLGSTQHPKFSRVWFPNCWLAFLAEKHFWWHNRFWPRPRKHDANLQPVLQRLEENNVRLKKEKCKFSHNQVLFHCHICSAEGIQADPTKITAIKEAQPLTNTGGVCSLLRMAQYVSRFLPQCATITAPLRMLTHKDVLWCWGPRTATFLQTAWKKF